MIVAVDFDGTIVEHEFPDIGAPVPGAVKWLKEWTAAGIRVILWTMRSNDQQYGNVLDDAIKFCTDNGIELYGVNENPNQDWSSSPKAYAHVYVDDAAFGCPLLESKRVDGCPYVDWSVVGPTVLTMHEKR